MKLYIKSSTTNSDYEPDIVLYVSNRLVYEGSPYSYELTSSIKELCMNPDVRESFINWLLECGFTEDDFDYDIVNPDADESFKAGDVANAVTDEIRMHYDEDEDFYLDGMGSMNLECFLAKDKVGASTAVSKKRYVRSNADSRPDYSKFSAWRDSDTCVVIDGEKCWYSKYKAYIDDNYTLEILQKYNIVTDTLYYVLLIFRGYKDMDVIETQFTNPQEAMEYVETTLIPEIIEN